MLRHGREKIRKLSQSATSVRVHSTGLASLLPLSTPAVRRSMCIVFLPYFLKNYLFCDMQKADLAAHTPFLLSSLIRVRWCLPVWVLLRGGFVVPRTSACWGEGMSRMMLACSLELPASQPLQYSHRTLLKQPLQYFSFSQNTIETTAIVFQLYLPNRDVFPKRCKFF